MQFSIHRDHSRCQITGGSTESEWSMSLSFGAIFQVPTSFKSSITAEHGCILIQITSWITLLSSSICSFPCFPPPRSTKKDWKIHFPYIMLNTLYWKVKAQSSTWLEKGILYATIHAQNVELSHILLSSCSPSNAPPPPNVTPGTIEPR